MPGKRGAQDRNPPSPPSSRDASAGGQKNGSMRNESARGLDPSGVQSFLRMLERQDRLGPDFLSDDDKNDWDAYLGSVPRSAAESMDARALLPVRMPPKCRPRAASSAGPSGTSIEQTEIISYSNSGGGRQFQPGERQRQHAAKAPLLVHQVPVGSTVAIRRDRDILLDSTPGYGTVFYLGDVVELVSNPSGTVSKLTVHYRMPQGKDGLFCNDMTKAWNLACHAHHMYDRHCERRTACKLAATRAGSQGSRFTYECDAAEVIETGILFNDKSNTLKAESKKRLCQSAPMAGEWDAQLGVSSKKQKV
jgi:hypothetical protein